MVAKVLSFLNQRIEGLHEAAYLLGFFAILSQVLALIRDRLLAGEFGAGGALDLYYASFRIPDIIFASIASLVSVYVLIPFISEKLTRSKEETRRFLGNVATFFLLTIGLVSILAFIAAPKLLTFLFPGFAGDIETLTLLTRVLLLQPILLGLSSLIGSVTQTFEKFLLFAVSPLLYNIGIIGGIVFLFPTMGLVGIIIGVVVGAFLHLLIQVPFILQERFLPKFTFSINWREIKTVMAISLPRTIALSINQIVLLVLVVFAATLTVGSVSVFSFALNLQAVPLTIIAVSYSVAAFPTLSRFISSGNREQFFLQVSAACRHIIFWSLPTIALVVVLRAQIVRVILGVGEFDWNDTRLTAAALALFIISLLAQGLILLLIRGYYAAGETRKPLLASLFGALISVTGALALTRLFIASAEFQRFVETLFRVEGIPGTEVLMLPLGFAFGQIIAALILLTLFERDFNRFPKTLSRTIFLSFSGAIIMGTTAYVFLNLLDEVFDLNTFTGIFLQGFIAGVAGLIAGGVFLRITKSEELAEMVHSISRRIFTARTVAPEELEP